MHSKPKKKPVKILWVDIETDGTDPLKNQVLEISCILTDHKLNQIGKPFHSLVLPLGDYDYLYENMVPVVQEMHTKNGLLSELKVMMDEYFSRPREVSSRDSRWLFVKRVETKILDWLNALWVDGDPVPEMRMAGHSINSLDFPFIRRHMPELAGALSHRTVDISSYVRFFTDVCEIPNEEIPFGLKEAGHRADDDNEMALVEGRKLREWIIEANELMKAHSKAARDKAGY